jgi:hypothetical protein
LPLDTRNAQESLHGNRSPGLIGMEIQRRHEALKQIMPLCWADAACAAAGRTSGDHGHKSQDRNDDTNRDATELSR